MTRPRSPRGPLRYLCMLRWHQQVRKGIAQGHPKDTPRTPQGHPKERHYIHPIHRPRTASVWGEMFRDPWRFKTKFLVQQKAEELDPDEGEKETRATAKGGGAWTARVSGREAKTRGAETVVAFDRRRRGKKSGKMAQN